MRSTPPVAWGDNKHKRLFRTRYELEQNIDAHDQASRNVDIMLTNILVCG